MTDAIKYFNGDDFPAVVWRSKYGQDYENTPKDSHLRLAKEFAKIRYTKDKSIPLQEWIDIFFNLGIELGPIP